MNGILFIDLGEVRTFEINGTQTIGRDGKNDIVITHPTVSRQHARIEMRQNHYVLTDFDSRNGTRINGKPITGDHPLLHGARMRIGHVRAWFFTNMPAKLPRSVTNRDKGIIFKCACGQRLWSAGDTEGMVVTCGGCNKAIEVPEQSNISPEDLGGTVAGVMVAQPTPEEKEIVCNVCHWPIEKADRKYKCPACALDFHLDCWRENQGCSAYGCSQVNALAPKERPAIPTIGSEPELANPLEETAIMAAQEAPQGFAWAYALLAASVLGLLLGILSFGVPPAIVAIVALVRLFVGKKDSKVILIASLLIGLLGAGVGAMISRFWWLGQPLF